MTQQCVKIGLAGFGTVGSGTYNVLVRNAQELTRRTGLPMEVKTVVCRDVARVKPLVDENVTVTTDLQSLINDPEIGIVVEVMGGIEPARTLVLDAIDAGKHVVTANKALLALHGREIFARAAQKGVAVAFEAAVAGGIPIIKALREGLAANHIEWVAGIINGTSNFILSTMRDEGMSFEDALKLAQANGYAEADPTFDIEGVDAAHKIAILSSLAFGRPVNFDACHIEGISKLEARDIEYAEQFGYRIKLLGITKRTQAGIELRVHPTLVPKTRLIANVEGVMNAVLVKGDAVGATLYYGRGAGSEPTASSVVADLVDIVRDMAAGNRPVSVPTLESQDSDEPWLSTNEVVSSYYMRIGVLDQPGVLADVSRIFGEHEISIEMVSQPRAAAGTGKTEIVVLTHEAQEGDILAAIADIEALPIVHTKVVMLRKEALN